ncbi:uncharacterized protein LOC106168738 [Lingula anatina]|uniref:Uncharacterized protein LOC106168738 n=1 Tax=Lingula anatina TaxID=7574 RepID=A0A2R2MSK8_LINAN|nr:uncharacterized protein LOC106168738 [Lingula anatina]|eukprot:XP_023933246.1 uncharacterized protein LOC106168738 [Lingula anatina]
MLTNRAAPPDDSESPASPDKTAVAERDHLDDIDKELLDKIEKIARGEHVEPEKQVTIWDFAGQDVYYTTHQTFLSERIIYLLVFRLNQDLDDKIRVYRGEKTLKEFIMFWLNSIHMHTIGKLREEDKNVMPYVLIIGTHKDMLCPQGDVEKIFDKLKKCLDDKQVLKDHVYRCFAISNLAEDDEEFAEIKRAIEDLCGYSSESEATVQHLPVSWIKLEMNLAEKSEETPIITIEKLREMAQRVGLPDGELQEKFIPYHHRQGDILHFKVDGLENVVIIDPLWLADVFSAIMTPASIHSVHSHSRGHFLKDELKRGVLKEEVFDEYLKEFKTAEKKTEIIRLMLHFDLMLEISQSVENPLPWSGKRRFVVPSMLVSNNSANNALSETDPQKYLLIAFPHILFPTGLFHRLIVRLLRKYRAQDYEHNIPVVGFDHASFRMVDKQSVLHLAIEEKAMRMMITNATGNKTKPHIYLNARKTVDEELSTLRKTYCPRTQFEFRIRVNNNGKDIAIKAEDVQENDQICCFVEGSEIAIDMTPYRIWFSDSAQAVQTSEPVGANAPDASFIDAQKFARLCYLVIELGTKVIRTFFLKDVVRPSITNGEHISDKDAVLQFFGKHDVKKELKKTKVIYASQWNLLYPASGHTDVETFDITLLVLLIRSLHPDKDNLKWPAYPKNVKLPSPPQTTQGFIDHIQRLKNVRNYVQHSAKYGIQDMEKFRTNWEIACASVLALGADPNEVEKVQKSIFSIQEIDTIVCEIRNSAEDNKRHFDSRFDRLESLIFFICAVLCAVLSAFAINYQWWI